MLIDRILLGIKKGQQLLSLFYSYIMICHLIPCYVFHKLLDCVSETAAAEMRSAYKVGFKDGATMMQEIQD